MSLTASQRARLGAFMTVTAVLAAVFIAIPIGFHLTNRQKHYYSYFQGESVSGLEKGAEVKFHGVPIGKVTDIAYDPRNLARVKVDLALDHAFPLKRDMFGEVGGMSITGIKYVEISGGSDTSALLEPGVELKTRQSFTSKITGKAEEIIAKIELLLDHLNALTHPDSSLGKIVDNVDVITHQAREFMTTMRPRVETGASSLENLLVRIDSISADVKAITSQTRTDLAGNRVGTIMSSIDSSARSVQRASEDISVIIRQSREDIMVAMQNLREALENANELTKVLTENPSLLIRGEQQKERELP